MIVVVLVIFEEIMHVSITCLNMRVVRCKYVELSANSISEKKRSSANAARKRKKKISAKNISLLGIEPVTSRYEVHRHTGEMCQFRCHKRPVRVSKGKP